MVDETKRASTPSRRTFLTGTAALAAGLAGTTASADHHGHHGHGMGTPGVTGDGITLNYIEKGRGRPLVLVPGWSQTAAMYRHQIDALSTKYRVIAVDMRGHGESGKPAHGYRIARLAADLHDFLRGMDLRDVVLGGHSMGCSVIWSYWDLFGGDRVSRLLIIDQAPTVTVWPGWTDAQKAEAGALFDPKSLYDTCAALAGPDGEKTTAGLVNGLFFTKGFPQDQLAWVLAENLKFPREYAARLLADHCMQDWRDTIPRIGVPTLVVGGEASFFTPASQRWIARQIPGAQAQIFGASEGGGHFMFMENPAKFNAMVEQFIG